MDEKKEIKSELEQIKDEFNRLDREINHIWGMLRKDGNDIIIIKNQLKNSQKGNKA